MWVPWSVTDDNEIAEKVLSYVPDDFSGKLLDIPVGTAVFTEKISKGNQSVRTGL